MSWHPITLPEQLVGSHERSTFDAKETYDLSLPKIRFELAKDIAAFASARGGTIIVGAVAPRGEVVALPGINNPSAIIEALAKAVMDRCRPLPTYDELTFEIPPELHARIVGRPVQATAPIAVLVINVHPHPSGPIGVHWGDKGAKVDHAFAFPLRLGDQTEWIVPEDLPMHMNSPERRIALQLRQIPGVFADRDGAAPVKVFHRKRAEGAFPPEPFQLVRLDERQQIIVLRPTYTVPPDFVANVPLTFVRAVWQEPSDQSWTIAIDGIVFQRHDEKLPRFIPSGRT